MKAAKPSLIYLFLVSFPKIQSKYAPRSEVLKETQVVLYTVSEVPVTSDQALDKRAKSEGSESGSEFGSESGSGSGSGLHQLSFKATGKCFGTLLSAKHVLLRAICLYDENFTLDGIGNALVARVIFHNTWWYKKNYTLILGYHMFL